jgi:hypothetical protein
MSSVKLVLLYYTTSLQYQSHPFCRYKYRGVNRLQFVIDSRADGQAEAFEGLVTVCIYIRIM